MFLDDAHVVVDLGHNLDIVIYGVIAAHVVWFIGGVRLLLLVVGPLA